MKSFTIDRMTGFDFDAKTNNLHFTGVDSAGATVSAIIPIKQPVQFFHVLGAEMFKNSGSSGTAQGLVVQDVIISGRGSPEDGYKVVFSFPFAADLVIHYLLEVATKSPTRFDAIKAHIDQVLDEARLPDNPSLQ